MKTNMIVVATVLAFMVFVTPAMAERTATQNTIYSTAPSSYGDQIALTQWYEYIGPWGLPDQSSTNAPKIGSSWVDNMDGTMTLSVDVAITTGDSLDYGLGEYVNAWVDWDDSGTFDAAEQVMDQLQYASAVGYQGTLNYVETFSCVTGTHWTRVNLGYGYDPLSGTDTWTYGDIEDILIGVEVDIKPGSYPNSINLDSNGKVPVAIFSSATFDATTVDPLTVTLADALVSIKGKGTPMSSVEDVNGDGYDDLVVHVDTDGLQLTDGDAVATVEGYTDCGIYFTGTDSIRIVPPT